MSAAAGFALGLAVALSIGMIIGFGVQSQQINPAKPLVQQGNFTWDLYTGSVVADSLVVNYRLYQGPSYYLLHMDRLPRPLAVPEGVATSAEWIQVRMRLFDPPVIQLNTMGWWEYIVSASQSNLAAMLPDAPCFLSDPPTCDLVGWSGGGLLGQNSFGFQTEGSFPTYGGLIQVFMQTIDNSNIDWTNATFDTKGPLDLTLFSA
jgi:hypothetical protein